MTHHISGFIGPEDKLKVQTKKLNNAKIIPLAQGFAFMPMGSELYSEVYKYNPKPMLWLAKRLGLDSIAWIETDYFGGFGEQSAITWINGKKHRYREQFGSNIDNAMKALGVVCEGDKDEFDTLGLGKYRTNESWLGQDW